MTQEIIDKETKKETEAKEKIVKLLNRMPNLTVWQICAMTGLGWDMVCLSLGRLSRDQKVQAVPRPHAKDNLIVEYSLI